ncbi:hypothetical protein K490DRAFT_12464, partial [Saccharata proteae CBS 121410]
PEAPEPPARKVFNCIVDDTAFLAGVKKSTRDGIRKWVNSGAMRLFVPLQTLNQIDQIKKANTKDSTNAKDALIWLDEVTSEPHVVAAGLVQLQGGDEIYGTWDEVEKHAMPQTLFTENEYPDDVDGLADELYDSYISNDSSDRNSSGSSTEHREKTPESPRSTCSSADPEIALLSRNTQNTAKANGALKSRDSTARNSLNLSRPKTAQKTSSVCPPRYRPFFNYVLWRIHHEQNLDISPESFIVLANDPAKQAIASRFSVRAKRLEQMRDIVGREERDYRNRVALFKKETGIEFVEEKPAEDPDSDEDEVVFKRPVVKAAPPKAGPQQVFDPNDFGRSQHIVPPAAPAAAPPTAPRGNRGGRGGPRGGRGGFAPAAPAAMGRVTPKPIDPNAPIDPNSFARPPPATRSFRGGRRKLWEP